MIIQQYKQDTHKHTYNKDKKAQYEIPRTGEDVGARNSSIGLHKRYWATPQKESPARHSLRTGKKRSVLQNTNIAMD